MSKQLLIDYTLFEIQPEMISESEVKNNGKVIVTGVLQRSDAKNQNGRVYPKGILEREVAKYKKNEISENRAVGELDHPESSVVNLKNVSHNILDCWWKGDDVMGKVEILSTPSGNILKQLMQHGIKLGISSRGMGSVKEVMRESGETLEVQPDFELIAFDFVSNPSTHGAFLSPVNESKGSASVNKFAGVERIITDIITEF